MPEVRTIDANALKKDLSEFNYEMAMRIVDTQPTIEPKARHGRWIQSDALDYKDKNGVTHIHGMCSCCKLIYDFRDMTSRFKFCPDCGAYMREEGADDAGRK